MVCFFFDFFLPGHPYVPPVEGWISSHNLVRFRWHCWFLDIHSLLGGGSSSSWWFCGIFENSFVWCLGEFVHWMSWSFEICQIDSKGGYIEQPSKVKKPGRKTENLQRQRTSWNRWVQDMDGYGVNIRMYRLLPKGGCLNPKGWGIGTQKIIPFSTPWKI